MSSSDLEENQKVVVHGFSLKKIYLATEDIITQGMAKF